MKKLFLLLAMALPCFPVLAYVGDVVTIDVFGNGSWYNSGTGETTYFQGTISADPSGGSANGQALVYTLPVGLTFAVDGDYALSYSAGGGVYDVVRLTGDNQLTFYSISGVDLASQSGLPTSQPSGTPTVSRLISGSGWQQESTVSSLTSAMPGYTGSEITYIFEIPEPATATLALVGAGVLALRRRMRGRK